MKNYLLCALTALFLNCVAGNAQTADVQFQYRAYFMNQSGSISDSRFKGDRYSLKIKGTVNDKFSYEVFQNLNVPISAQEPFAGTDWAYLRYAPDDNWYLDLGKLESEYGGWEYDASPIDIPYAAEYWCRFKPFQFGVTAGRIFGSGNDKIAVQVNQSPFRANGPDLFGYSLRWKGDHGLLHTSYSLNMFEYDAGRYSCHLSLGNKIKAERLTAELDVISRCDASNFAPFEDMTFLTYLRFRFDRHWEVFAKLTKDFNNGFVNDCLVSWKSDLGQIGGGFRYYPLEDNDDLLFQAMAVRCYGVAMPDSALVTDLNTIKIGFVWKFWII